MGMPGPQKINRYGTAFKLKAVQMSNAPGVLIKDVAESLYIHPFMLSRWRKQVRDGELVGQGGAIESQAVLEPQRLREIERKYWRLQMAHDLLKKAIRFARQLKRCEIPSSSKLRLLPSAAYLNVGGTASRVARGAS